MAEITEKNRLSVLVIRLSAIGDVIMASGIAQAIREKHPDAHITFLSEPLCAKLLQETEAVDEIIVLPRAELSQLLKEKKYLKWYRRVVELSKQLQQRNFHWALDTQGLLKSGIWARLSGAKRRVGLGSKELSHLFMTEQVSRPADDPLISSEYRKLMRHLQLPEKRALIGVNEQTEKLATEKRRTVCKNQQYMVFCPFTTRPQKHWVDENWIDLANRVFQQYKMPSIILGGPANKARAHEMSKQSEHLVSLAGETNLLESASVIYQAQALIGVDTGMTHLAHNHQQPAVCLFGSTRPYLDADNPNAKVIYHDYSCSPCRRKPTCGGEFGCMTSITPEEVVNELMVLFPPEQRLDIHE